MHPDTLSGSGCETKGYPWLAERTRSLFLLLFFRGHQENRIFDATLLRVKKEG